MEVEVTRSFPGKLTCTVVRDNNNYVLDMARNLSAIDVIIKFMAENEEDQERVITNNLLSDSLDVNIIIDL